MANISNDPQASLDKKKKDKQKRIEKMDKLASDVAYYGASAIAGIGGATLGA